MLVRADHKERTRAPPVVLVKMPPSLDPLHRCAAFVAGRRGKGDEIRSRHGIRSSLAVCVAHGPGRPPVRVAAQLTSPDEIVEQSMCPQCARVVLMEPAF
jgi:hypothetical protein